MRIVFLKQRMSWSCVKYSVVHPDPDGSGTFALIRIWILLKYPPVTSAAASKGFSLLSNPDWNQVMDIEKQKFGHCNLISRNHISVREYCSSIPRHCNISRGRSRSF